MKKNGAPPAWQRDPEGGKRRKADRAAASSLPNVRKTQAVEGGAWRERAEYAYPYRTTRAEKRQARQGSGRWENDGEHQRAGQKRETKQRPQQPRLWGFTAAAANALPTQEREEAGTCKENPWHLRGSHPHASSKEPAR